MRSMVAVWIGVQYSMIDDQRAGDCCIEIKTACKPRSSCRRPRPGAYSVLLSAMAMRRMLDFSTTAPRRSW